ncbi:MAG: PC4/YdbC family ssDNA-binding protein [Ezakiella sp.]|mgnify:FL=1|uniref:YdbC family protein n=1 Tax=Ezakiella sp. TaxID=1935205 RepID=UPI002976D274|nr:PC4/YdbC family ssDNA-binding protein [Ezakiella sp.]MDD7730856.1 PC4/YdbC family ssDNA-binding protein [Eubacteriales bacterium]MDY6080272.1 PC4/YdbC family ssDNA-binding protein [Ezakiella sp.]
MADFKYEILDNVGVFFNSKNGWTKEINIISWNGADGKVDIRSWSPDHSRMGKGISLTVEEFKALKELMDEINPDDL